MLTTRQIELLKYLEKREEYTTTKELAEEFRLLHRDFPLKIYGGCCGTDESHIREMIKVLQ